MSELVFIRHGQASFGQGDYDILSDLGKEQSLLAAQYLLHTGLSFDRAYSGTLNRQVDTAAVVLAHLQTNSAEAPPLRKVNGLNEYPFESIIRHYFPLLAEEDRSLHPHVEKAYTDKRSFQLLFDLAVNRWLAGEEDPEGVEGWNRFVERVEASIQQIATENDKHSRILIFSSGGVISAALHLATGMTPYASMRTGWGLVNTSITKFRFGSAGLILHTFNSYPHLENHQAGELITYR
ncbi:MAG TPA: histidine phosphatase family protein [Syntrophomonadaceae bacterium]|nr:histidine phosphatase family protein [Syntrophomonadaceae bacterium]HPR94056.1 histidine phosphatase family protein [Syntrophomonadaceae bacterium]